MLGGAMALNTVIDEQRRLAFVTFGEIDASHSRRSASSGAMRRSS